MNVLNEIIEYKKTFVEERKSLYPVKLLERSPFFDSQTVSLKKYLLRNDLNGIIAEFKRKSPSKGFINKYADIEKVSVGYMMAGASALSILTDEKYFGGSDKDLSLARKFNYCPLLRKEFVIDEYQIIEAKSIGADAILLLANVLSKKQLADFYALAQSLNLETLFEIRDEEEIDKLPANASIVGINNRNLKSFEVSLDQSLHLVNRLPSESVKVSESGISSVENIKLLREHGFKGFLIGETFMHKTNPAKACSQFINELKKLN
jgi:indole-3-glycerol phosphate synthase